jgi:hypothetical protein
VFFTSWQSMVKGHQQDEVVIGLGWGNEKWRWSVPHLKAY